MNKYTFRLQLLDFKHPLGLQPNEIDFRRVHESLQEIRIVVSAQQIGQAIEKAKGELVNVLSVNFGNVPLIDFYVIKLKLVEVTLV